MTQSSNLKERIKTTYRLNLGIQIWLKTILFLFPKVERLILFDNSQHLKYIFGTKSYLYEFTMMSPMNTKIPTMGAGGQDSAGWEIAWQEKICN